MQFLTKKVLATFLFILISFSASHANNLVMLSGSKDYNPDRVNAILKNTRNARGIGIGLLSALDRAVAQKLFSNQELNSKGVRVAFASSGGPIQHLRNPHQLVLENISIKGRQVKFDLTVHTDEWVGIAAYRINSGLPKAGLNFFKNYHGKTVVIETLKEPSAESLSPNDFLIY